MPSSTDHLSPRSAIPDQQATPLERLVSHLLASKRSLSSVSHVMRANELVTSTRKTLETNVITTARTSFIRRAIDEQVDMLKHIHTASESVGRKANVEFEAVLNSLDEAEQRLSSTLDRLRETYVEPGLRPEGEVRRSLLDFVDESGVDTLLGTVKQTVDKAGMGHKAFTESNIILEKELLGVNQLLSKRRAHVFEDSVEDAEISSPIPGILADMEDHAREMAGNLESLVKHYDLCVSAIKHTEGGGDAAQRIATSLAEGVDIGGTDLDASSDPITEEERLEMINIIEKDASQVEEVVLEIRDQIAEMESQEQLLLGYVDICAEEHANTNSAFNVLEDIGCRLPAFINQSQAFLMQWENDRARLEDHKEELAGLREFYDGFLTAYDKLLIEVGRRKTLEAKVDSIIQDAMSKIGRLYDGDAEARSSFKAEQGEFLPVDIWPAVTSGPVQYKVVNAEGPPTRLPEVPNIVIQQAVERLRRHQ